MTKPCLHQGLTLQATRCQAACVLIVFTIIFFAPKASAEDKSFCIVVAGDCRADYPWNRKRPEDDAGINQRVIDEIAGAIAKDKDEPKVLLWTGDIVNVSECARTNCGETTPTPAPNRGEITPEPNCAGLKAGDKAEFLRSGLQKWRQIMDRHFKSKGITILPVRGNHEVEWHWEKDRNPFEIESATKTWQEVWNDVLPLPSDGQFEKVGETDQGTSFAYVTGPALCIGLDAYETRRHLIHQSWLDDVLQKNNKRFVFAFSHEPAFVTGGNHTREETFAAYPHYRDHMLEKLQAAGARVFLCGHDHFYDHMVARKPWTPNDAEMHQFTAGTAGAPYYTRQSDYPADEDWQLEQRKHSDFVYGYLCIVIKEEQRTATIEFKARQPNGEYLPIDTFNYQVPPP